MRLVATERAAHLDIEAVGPPGDDSMWAISALLVGVLACFIAAGRLLASATSVVQPWAWDYAEPIVYAQAMRVVQGDALYQPVGTPPLTVTAYTPLYYVAAAFLHALLGQGLWIGRALSYVSGLLCAACVGRLTYLALHSRWPAIVAAAMFLGLGFSGSVPWFALYRVDTLGLAFSLAAVSVLASGTRRRALLLAGVLAGLGLLTKQTFFAAPIAGTLWLASRGSRQDAAAYLGTALLVAGVPCVMLATVEPAFVENAIVANVNPLAPLQLGFLWPAFEFSLAPATLIAALYVLPVRRARAALAPPTRLAVMYWGWAAVSLLGLIKFGAFYNYWIEFAAGTSILAVTGIWKIGGMYADLGSRLMACVPVWLLILDLGWIAGVYVTSVPGSAQAAMDTSHRTAFAQLVQRVRDEPGPVLAEPMDVVVLAGRQLVLEPVIFGILQRQGTWDPEPLVHSVCSGEVRLLILEMPLPSLAEYAPFGMPWWPEPVVRALQARMVATGEQAGRTIYTPAARPSSAGANVCR